MHACVTSTIVSIACVIFVETIEGLNYKKSNLQYLYLIASWKKIAEVKTFSYFEKNTFAWDVHFLIFYRLVINVFQSCNWHYPEYDQLVLFTKILSKLFLLCDDIRILTNFNVKKNRNLKLYNKDVCMFSQFCNGSF